MNDGDDDDGVDDDGDEEEGDAADGDVETVAPMPRSLLVFRA